MRKGTDEVDATDPGEYAVAKVKSSYNDKTYEGIVEVVCRTHREPKWVIRFQDGHVTTIRRKRLNKILLHTESIKTVKQIDYIFVSHRSFLYEHDGCTARFKTEQGMLIHVAPCPGNMYILGEPAFAVT